jgi:chemotaxis signal transduction protein
MIRVACCRAAAVKIVLFLTMATQKLRGTAAPPGGARRRLSQAFITGVIKRAERLWFIMDVDRMFSDAESETLSGL